MKASLIMDIGTGHVYTIPCESLRQARVIVRGPFYPEARAVVKTSRLIECYDRRVLVSVEHL